MTTKSIGFIGGGRVTRMILEGWRCGNAMPEKIVVSDPNAEALAKLKALFPGIEILPDGNSAVAASRDIVFLAVHPPAMAEAGAGIKDSLAPGAIVVSLAPKFTIAKLGELLGGFSRLARMIPNAPCIIGAGFNPVVSGSDLTAGDKAELAALLAPLGECPEICETKLEGYALLTAMGPTYLWFQLQALRELAAEFGLDDSEIPPALINMVCGATRALLESGLAPAEVMDLVPVKPLAEMESSVGELYRTRLPALYQKIKP